MSGGWKVLVVGISVCIISVIILLTILFVVMTDHPQDKIEVASTDMRLLHKVSSVWCGWQEVKSSHPITVYRVTGEPDVHKAPFNNYHFHYQMKLNFGKERQLKYHLLPSSSIDIRACTDRDGIFLRVFKGLKKWKRCVHQRRLYSFQRGEDSSSEESKEDEGSERLWNFIKQKNNMWNVGWYPKNCEEFRSRKIPILDEDEKCVKSTLSLRSNDEATYIFSVEDYHLDAEESHTNIHVLLNRTTYDVSHLNPVCYDSTDCDVSLTFGSDDRSLLTVASETDAGAVAYTVVASCKPRVFFFILLFALLPLVVLVCVGCVIICRKSRNNNTYKYVQVFRNTQEVSTPTVPLLAGPGVTLYSKADSENRTERTYSGGSTPPPPYSPPTTENPNLHHQ